MKQTALFKGSVLLLLLTTAGVPALGVPHGSSTPRQKALDDRLLHAIQRRDTRAVRVLLHQGANPNVQFSTDVFASFKDSTPAGSIREDALGMALNVYDADKICLNTDIVTALLEHGARLTGGGRRGVTVYEGRFHHAAPGEFAYYVDVSWKTRYEGDMQETFVGSDRQLDRLKRAAQKAGAAQY